MLEIVNRFKVYSLQHFKVEFDYNTLQTQFASLILKELLVSDEFDVLNDHDSYKSIFNLANTFLEQHNGNFLHKLAAGLIMQNKTNISSKILELIKNASFARYENFAKYDLLMIDVLKPAVDLLRTFCFFD